MPSPALLRLAVLSDLHVGVAKLEGWHNRLISTDADETLAPTVSALQRWQPDLVVVTGDVTSEGTFEQLIIARSYLDRLGSPYLVCKGNHDQRSLGSRRAFEQVFGKRAPVGVVDGPAWGLPANVALLLLDAHWLSEDGQPSLERPATVTPPLRMVCPPNLMDEAVIRLEALRPRLLLVFSHFPLVPHTDYLAEVRGKDAGHLVDGVEGLRSLLGLTGAVACFTGHQHFHHITPAGRWLQCATGALAEFPGEYRLVELDHKGMRLSLASAVEPALARAARSGADWVVGRPQDREYLWSSPALGA